MSARCENCEDETGQDYYCRGGDHSCSEATMDTCTSGMPGRFKISYEFNGELWYFWVCADCYDKYYSDTDNGFMGPID